MEVRPAGSVDTPGKPALPMVPDPLDYAEDHAEAVAMLVETAMPRLEGRRGRLLEIGSIWMAHHL